MTKFAKQLTVRGAGSSRRIGCHTPDASAVVPIEEGVLRQGGGVDGTRTMRALIVAREPASRRVVGRSSQGV